MRQLSEDLPLKNDKSFEGLESMTPAQKVAYTMSETTISYCFRDILQVSKPSLAIVECQAMAITLKKRLSSYLKVANYAKNNTQLQARFSQ